MNRVFLTFFTSFCLLSAVFLIGLSFNIQPVKAGKVIVPDGFPTIQEAVDAANPGDTIFVKTGTYLENVFVNKNNLTLIGESIENTVIDGNGTGTAVTMWHAPDVTISGFTIQNSGAGIYLDTSPYNNITGNTISNNLNGITLSYSHDAILVGNTVTNNTSCGIVLDFSAGSTLRSNSISNNRYNLMVESPGSYLWSISEWIYDIDTSNTVDGKPVYYWVNQHDTQIPGNAGYIAVINSTRIIIENVTLTNNGQGILFFYTSNSTIANATITNNEHGIVLSYSWNNTIMQNKITNSGGEGIQLVVSHFNTIENNSISDNGLKGIGVFEGSTSNNIIENVIANNAGGVSIEGGSGNNIVENIITNSSGVFIMGSSNDIIKNTIVNNNAGNGIFMWPGSDSNITENIIMNSEYGIYLDGGSQNNKIYRNSITNNKFGIYVAHFSNTIYQNNFVNNEKQAYNHYLGFKNIWDDGYPSGGNFWDDYGGLDADGDGIGDAPYIIDTDNQDRYPLTTPSDPIPIVWDGTIYPVEFKSNSTISRFNFNATQGIVSFNVTGPDYTLGFCNITIPNNLVQDLWQENITVLVDGKEPTNLDTWTDGTYTHVYVVYPHSQHEVAIIPEFPSFPILPSFMVVTLLAVIVYRRKTKISDVM